MATDKQRKEWIKRNRPRLHYLEHRMSLLTDKTPLTPQLLESMGWIITTECGMSCKRIELQDIIIAMLDDDAYIERAADGELLQVGLRIRTIGQLNMVLANSGTDYLIDFTKQNAKEEKTKNQDPADRHRPEGSQGGIPQAETQRSAVRQSDNGLHAQD